MSVLNISRLQREPHGGIVAHSWVVAIYHLNDKDTHTHTRSSVEHKISIQIMQFARHALLWRNQPNVLIMSQCVYSQRRCRGCWSSPKAAQMQSRHININQSPTVESERPENVCDDRIRFSSIFSAYFRVSAVAAFGSCVTCPYIRCGFRFDSNA